MARKNTLEYTLLEAQPLDAAFESPVTLVKQLDNCSYQINITNTTSTGFFVVQASNDYGINEITNDITFAGTWADLPLGGTPTLQASNDTILINLNQLPFKAIRIVYVPNAPGGDGLCDIKLFCKQIGG